jgi:hypothetical protein
MDIWGGIGRGNEDFSVAWSGVCRTLVRARRSNSSSFGPNWCAARSYISEVRRRAMRHRQCSARRTVAP